MCAWRLSEPEPPAPGERPPQPNSIGTIVPPQFQSTVPRVETRPVASKGPTGRRGNQHARRSSRRHEETRDSPASDSELSLPQSDEETVSASTKPRVHNEQGSRKSSIQLAHSSSSPLPKSHDGPGAFSGESDDEYESPNPVRSQQIREDPTSGMTDSELVDHVLSKPPPPDPVEYISRQSAAHQPFNFFAPLISGTTKQEEELILQEEARAGRHHPALKVHPEYKKTMQDEPNNAGRLAVFREANPYQKIAIAGRPEVPLHVDPPGAGGPLDALKHPDFLIELLNRNETDLPEGWNRSSLRKIPQTLLVKLKPEVLGRMPMDIRHNLPESIKHGLPRRLAPYPSLFKADEGCLNSGTAEVDDSPGLIYERRRKPKGEAKKHKKEPSDEEAPPRKSARVINKRKQTKETKNAEPEIQESGDESGSVCEEEAPSKLHPQPCANCIEDGVKCSRQLPQCDYCVNIKEICSFTKHPFMLSTKSSQSSKRPPYKTSSLPPPPLVHPGASTSATVAPAWIPFRLIENDWKWTGTHQSVFNMELNTPILPALESSTRPSQNLKHFFTWLGDVLLTDDRLALQEENFYNRPSIRITIPDLLKNFLVDDWENVTKSCLLVPLPSKKPVNWIFDEYFDQEKHNRRLGSPEADVLEEFCSGMKIYFEKCLGKILLYRFERAQLHEVRKWWETSKYPGWEGKGPGDCYGAEHLCRMLVNLPEMIAQTNMDAQSVSRLKEEISKFCTWLARNSNEYFTAKYEKPTPEYAEANR